MDICLESFNPYREVETINEGTNIFSKALEILSKIWHKILDTITGLLNKFKKKNDVVTPAQFKKFCKRNNITEFKVPVIKNLGKMFKSHDNLTDWIDYVGEGLNFVSRFISSPGGDGKIVDRINAMKDDMAGWYAHLLKYTSTTGFDINKDLDSFVKIIKSAMIIKDYDGTTIPISDENILSWNGTGYSLEQVFDDDVLAKMRDSVTKLITSQFGLRNAMNNFKISTSSKSNTERLDVIKKALRVVIKTNQAVGEIVNKYVGGISIIRVRALTLMIGNSGTAKQEYFAYIR